MKKMEDKVGKYINEKTRDPNGKCKLWITYEL